MIVHRLLNITLWVAQVLLALIFAFSGLVMATGSIEEMSTSIPWVLSLPVTLVRIIGVCEVLGAIGLLLPSFLRIKPYLTSLAAVGIVAIMFLAMCFHLIRNEFAAIGINIIYGGVAYFIAWGRYHKIPIVPKK